MTVLTRATSCFDAGMFDKCQFQSSEACFPTRSSNTLINQLEWTTERSGEACRHYIKAEFLSDFLLKACFQMPIIRTPKATLHFLSLCSITDPPLWMAGICCSSIIFLTIMSLKKNLACYCSCMRIVFKSNRLYILHPVIEEKIIKHLPYWLYYFV